MPKALLCMETLAQPPLVKFSRHESGAQSLGYHDEQLRGLWVKFEKISLEIRQIDETNFFGIDNLKRILIGVQDRIDCCLQDLDRHGLLLLDSDVGKADLYSNQIRESYNNIKQDLVQANEQLTEKKRKLFTVVRQQIKDGVMNDQKLRERIEAFLHENENSDQTPNWQIADSYVNGILDINEVPTPLNQLEAGMVFYDPTAIDGILQLIDAVNITSNDVVYDIGSGLGRVPMVVSLITKARSVGIEKEILEEVVKNIYKQAEQRKIRIALRSIGNFLALTESVAGKTWLKVIYDKGGLRVYESIVDTK